MTDPQNPRLFTEAQQIEALKRYAEFDRSDPFAFARSLSHIRAGLCGPCKQSEMRWLWREGNRSTGVEIGPPVGEPGHYDARRIGLTAWGSVTRL